MGFLDKIFGGGDSKTTRDEKSVQSDINKALKDSGGEWTRNLNDLVAERDRARSGATTSSSGRNALSQGLGSFGRAVSSIPGNIARDVKMGTSAGLFSGRDKQAENLASKGFTPTEIQDYFARTDATIARNAAQQGSGRSDRSNDAPFRAPIGGDVDEQGPVYKNPFGSPQNPTISGGKGSRTPQPTEISPEMRREALRIFESQRGAGQVPYQMQPYQQGLGSMPPPQGLSPAFQYAAQNFDRLGGSQRLMDRPMEMMSVAERQRINDMAQGMQNVPFDGRVTPRPTPFPGKGNVIFEPQPSPDGMRQPETLSRILPLLGQMGLGGFRGPGMPPR
jgi:hypothetical protein